MSEEWFPASEIDAAERHAIERDHPLYNTTYNHGWRVEFTAKVEVEDRTASPEEIAARLAAVIATGMAVVWLFDTIANWSVRRRAAAAGQEITVPPARNLFTQDPPHWSATALAQLLAAAAPPRPDGAPGHRPRSGSPRRIMVGTPPTGTRKPGGGDPPT